MAKAPEHDWLKELRQLAADAENERTSPNRTQCGALVEAVELFLDHLEGSALEITTAGQSERGGYETVIATAEQLQVGKRYAFIAIEPA